MKELATHHPKDAIVYYHMWNTALETAVTAETIKVLTDARDMESNVAMEQYKWDGAPIPNFSLTLKVPHIPNQDTSKFDQMPSLM